MVRPLCDYTEQSLTTFRSNVTKLLILISRFLFRREINVKCVSCLKYLTLYTKKGKSSTSPFSFNLRINEEGGKTLSNYNISKLVVLTSCPTIPKTIK